MGALGRGQDMKCLNCGYLDRHHGDPNLPAMSDKVLQPCDNYEPDYEAQLAASFAELAEWYADLARDRDIDSRLERERERNHDTI